MNSSTIQKGKPSLTNKWCPYRIMKDLTIVENRRFPIPTLEGTPQYHSFLLNDVSLNLEILKKNKNMWVPKWLQFLVSYAILGISSTGSSNSLWFLWKNVILEVISYAKHMSWQWFLVRMTNLNGLRWVCIDWPITYRNIGLSCYWVGTYRACLLYQIFFFKRFQWEFGGRG